MKNYIYIIQFLLISIIFSTDLSSFSIRVLVSRDLKVDLFQQDSFDLSDKTSEYNDNLLRDVAIAGILPGSIQLINGQKKKSLILLSIESLALSSYFYNSYRGMQVQGQYQEYANTHWSFSRWVSDYYNWRGSDEFGHLFNFPDGTINGGPCGSGPFGNDNLYPCIDEGHGIGFSIDLDGIDGRQYTNSSSFEQVYEVLCGVNDLDNDQSVIDEDCVYDDEVVSALLDQYNFELYFDQHFYENVGKYDSFFAGWLDNSDLYEYKKTNGDRLAMSDHKSEYRDIWSEFNEGYLKYASYSLAAITANHFISMLDILISNRTNDKVSVAANINSDRFDLYKIKLSVKF